MDNKATSTKATPELPIIEKNGSTTSIDGTNYKYWPQRDGACKTSYTELLDRERREDRKLREESDASERQFPLPECMDRFYKFQQSWLHSLRSSTEAADKALANAEQYVRGKLIGEFRAALRAQMESESGKGEGAVEAKSDRPDAFDRVMRDVRTYLVAVDPSKGLLREFATTHYAEGEEYNIDIDDHIPPDPEWEEDVVL